MKPSISTYQGLLAQILLKKEQKEKEKRLQLIRAF